MSNEYFSSFNGVALGPSSSGTFEIGKFATSNKSTQFALDQTTTPKALDVCADDGGVAIGAGSDVMAGRFRMLVRTAIAGSPDLSIEGLEGILKYAGVAVTSTANQAGVWAYFESVSGSSFGGYAAGLHAMVSLPSGATLNSGGILSGVLITADTLGGTSSGTMAAICIPNPGAGSWDYFLQTGDSPGFVESTARTGTTSTRNLTVLIGDTVLYIPLIAATLIRLGEG
jgi:hypothetical protein